MKRYKMAVISGVFLIMMFIPYSITYAGSINSAEAGLLEYLGKTFTYNGHQYEATSSALAIARAKLSEDGIDLTENQVAKAKNLVESNLQTGIESGYLVRVDKEIDPEPSISPTPGASSKPSATPTSEPTAAPTAKQIEEDPPSDIKTTKTQEPSASGIINEVQSTGMASEDAMPVKNTGLSIGTDLLRIGILGGLFFLLIIISCKYIIFAKKNGS